MKIDFYEFDRIDNIEPFDYLKISLVDIDYEIKNNLGWHLEVELEDVTGFIYKDGESFKFFQEISVIDLIAEVKKANWPIIFGFSAARKEEDLSIDNIVVIGAVQEQGTFHSDYDAVKYLWHYDYYGIKKKSCSSEELFNVLDLSLLRDSEVEQAIDILTKELKTRQDKAYKELEDFRHE